MHTKDVERSPVFLQFLDAIWQLMQQFPASFEFTEDLLVLIMEHLYSSRFGTFLLNSDKVKTILFIEHNQLFRNEKKRKYTKHQHRFGATLSPTLSSI